MSKRKIVAIALFIFMSMFIFTFANPGGNEPTLAPGNNGDNTNDNNQEGSNTGQTDLDEDPETTLGENEEEEENLFQNNNNNNNNNNNDNNDNDDDNNDNDDDNNEDDKPAKPSIVHNEESTVGTIEENIFSKLVLTANDLEGLTTISLNKTTIYDQINATTQEIVIDKNTANILEENVLTICNQANECIDYNFTLDFEAPTIYNKTDNSSIDGLYFNSSVEFTVHDKVGLAHLEKNGIVRDLSKNNNTLTYTVNNDGVVEVLARDLAGNEATAKFTIDSNAPVISVKKTFNDPDKTDNNFMDVKLLLEDELIKSVNINGKEYNKHADKERVTIRFNANKKYAVNGENIIIVTDYAGNQTTYTFMLDTTAPVINFDKAYATAFYQYDFANLSKDNIISRVESDGTYTYNVEIMYAKPYGEFTTVETLDGSKVGTYIIKVTATDEYGRSTTIEHTLTNDYKHQEFICGVLNNEACDMYMIPRLGILPLYDGIKIIKGTSGSLNAIAGDYIDNEFFSTHDLSNAVVINNGGFDANTVGIYTVTFTVTDWTGKQVIKTYNIEVVGSFLELF